MQNSTKKSVLKPCYIVSAIVLVILIAVNAVCGIFGVWITHYLCATTSLDRATRDKGDKLATQIVEDGVVMVKNDDSTLPLSDTVKKVNVFGWASSEWVGGGSGSGRVVNSDKSNGMTPNTDLLKALDERDIEYNPALPKMYESFQAGRDYWSEGTLNASAQQFYRLYEPSINDTNYYTNEIKTNAINFSETAIVVLGRVAGESNDCPTVQYKRTAKNGSIKTDSERTYLDISTEEEDLLKYVGENYTTVIVIINSTNVMNLSFMDSIDGLDACLIAGGTGNNAVTGLVNVLYGCDKDGRAVSPSGRTADTYAYDFKYSPAYYSQGAVGTNYYKDSKNLYPATGTPSTVNGDDHYRGGVSYTDYVEGVYVGYKWYETADAEGYWADVDNKYGKGYEGVVQYPFGYGLSYATFSWEVVTPGLGGTLKPDGTIDITVRVKNTSKIYSGKEVVQLYYTAPYTKGGIEKPSVVLAAFAKTPTMLLPGETQDVTLTFDVRDMASYDSQEIKVAGGGYILEEGDYEIKFMKNAHEVAKDEKGKDMTYTYRLGKDHTYPIDSETGNPVSNVFTGDSAWDGLSIDGSNTNGNITWLSRADFKATFKGAKDEARTMTQEMIDQHLYDEADANKWQNAQGSVTMPTTDFKGDLRLYENGEITELGLELGDPDNYDSALWDDLLDQMTLKEMVDFTLHGYTHEIAVSSIGKIQTDSVDGPAQAGSFNQPKAGVGYPNATVLAQSWDTELAKSFGLALAADAVGVGYEGLYAPGVNIHRTPFGGRNYEYYSEDSCLTGAIGAATVNGCLDGGVYVYVKHFALYEQEDRRDGMYTWLTEQTLREVYLSPFKTLIEDGKVTGFMSSYGRVGCVWAGGNTGLLTNVLRDEWGFKGAVITDYSDHHQYMNYDQMIRAGGDLWMDNWVHNGTAQFETKSAAFVTRAREASKHVLYMTLNARYREANASDEDIVIKRGGNTFAWWIPVLIAVDVIAVGACVAWVFLTLKKEKSLVASAPAANEVINE